MHRSVDATLLWGIEPLVDDVFEYRLTDHGDEDEERTLVSCMVDKRMLRTHLLREYRVHSLVPSPSNPVHVSKVVERHVRIRGSCWEFFAGRGEGRNGGIAI